MNTGNTDMFEQAYLEQWLKTTRHYLFADQECLSNAAGKALLESRLDSHGAQGRFISRARGRLLHLLKRTAQHDQNPLQELERAFYFQASFVSRHPDVPKRLLEWLSQGSDTRIRRRIQKVIGHYESRLCQMIGQAKQQGLIRADIESHTAASLFVAMIQGLALRMNVNPREQDLLLHEAFEVFALYRAGMACASK